MRLENGYYNFSEVKNIFQRVQIDLLIRDVCDALVVGVNNFYSTERKRETVDARKIAIKIIIDIVNNHNRYEYLFGWTQLASIINKDHATVIHNYNVATSLLKSDPKFKAKFAICEPIYRKHEQIYLSGGVTKRDELHIDC